MPAMSVSLPTGDQELLEAVRREGPQTIPQLVKTLGVTSTAIRQRLQRLRAEGFLERTVSAAGRGRPSHKYALTEKARQQASSNFHDLALALWQEVRSIKDREIRRGLLQRIAGHLASGYVKRIQGNTLADRMSDLCEVFQERGIGLHVDTSGSLPVLSARDCPYPELAEHDRTICSMERILFSQLLEENVRLAECRLDGHSCCRFETV